MKCVPALFLFLFISVNSYGQDDKKGLSFFFAPSFAISSLEVSDEAFSEFANFRKENDQARGGVYLGLLLEKRLRQNINLQIGATLSLLQVTSGRNVVLIEQQGPNPRRKGYYYTQEFYHVGLPVNFKKVFFEKGGFGFYALAGVQLDYLLSATFQRMYLLDDGSIENTYNEFENLNARKVNTSANFGIGVHFRLDKMVIFIQPQCRAFLLNQWHHGLTENIATLNMTMGVKF